MWQNGKRVESIVEQQYRTVLGIPKTGAHGKNHVVNSKHMFFQKKIPKGHYIRTLSYERKYMWQHLGIGVI